MGHVETGQGRDGLGERRVRREMGHVETGQGRDGSCRDGSGERWVM